MKQLISSLFIFILCLGLTAAVEVVTKEKNETIAPELSGVSVTTSGNQIIITAQANITNVHVFLDNTLLQTFDYINEGKNKRISTALTGEHIIEVRYLKDHHYIWERPSITTNDYPTRLKYLDYDKDKKELSFGLLGTNIIHKDQLTTTTNSVNEVFTDFDITINDAEQVTICYAYITTGKNPYFECKSKTTPSKVDIILTLGVKENYNLTISGGVAAEEEEEITVVQETIKETTIETIPEAEKNTTAEIIPLDTIQMSDTIKKSSIPIPITVFVIFVAISIGVLIYIVMRHNSEIKEEAHHPKKTKLERMEEDEERKK
jgi:hypothetical protein